MIPQDLKKSPLHSHTWKISDEASQTVEHKTNQFTTTLLQSSDHEAILKAQASSQIERSKSLIHLETKQKVSFPKDVEAHYYKQLLQAKRENLAEEQIFYLERLSEHYLQKQNWIQAAKLLNCAFAIFEKNLENPPFQTYLLTRLERIEALFLESKGFKTPSQHKGTVLNYRSWLKNIRTLYLQKYQEKVPIQEITTFLTNSYKKLLGTLILDSQELIGKPPTQWACVGMGSMARDEMCPYSDLEFAFLIHNKTKQTLEYFRTLSQLLELRIINIGETKFPIFAQLFGERSMAASPTPGGFSMDSGGNSPLGKPGFYELIDTPKGLAQYQCIEWMEADIIVTNALSTTCYIVGDEQLVYDYNRAKEEALNATDGFFSFTGIPFRIKLALKLLQGNLHEFKPNLSIEKQETSAFGIKKELYRPLQALIGNLTLFSGFELQSTFAMIQQLLKKGVLSSKGAANLTKALSQILSLRFEAHTFYQNEEELLLHIEQEVPQDPHFLYLDEENLKTLHDIYMVLIPLQNCGEKFSAMQEIQIFAKESFYDESPSVQGEAFSKTLQYASAHKAYQNAVSLNPNDIDAQLNLGAIEQTMGQSKEALSRYLKALALAQKKYGEKHLYVTTSYSYIGSMYYDHSEYDKALEFYQKALKIQLQIAGQNHPDVATSYNNIGWVYNNLGEYDKALEFHQKALQTKLQVAGENHPSVATSYSNIGFVYDKIGEYDKALEFYQKALKIRLLVAGENHPDVATSYNNIGLIYDTLGEYDKALECHQKALKIQLQVTDENDPDVVTSYSNIGSIYKNLEEYDKALEFHQKALKLKLLVLGENHPDVAISYNNIGLVYYNLGEFNKALEFYQKALRICLEVLGENHPNLAGSYNNIGSIYKNLGEYAKALEFHQKALKIQLQVVGESHPHVATIYNNIGSVYHYLREYNNALEFHQKALKLDLQMLGENHPEVATSYSNIGSVYKNLGQYDKALEFHQKALKIQLQVAGEDHPSVASSYNDIGLIYKNLGEYDKALKSYQIALKIQLQVAGENHPDVATSYKNISLVYKNLGQYDKALEFHQKALKIQLQVLGENHPSVASSYNNIGLIYKNLGEYDKALEFYQKALKIKLLVLGENHPTVPSSYSNIGSVYKNLGEYDKALEFYQKALKLWLKAYEKNHPEIERALESLIVCAKKTSSTQVQTLGEISVLCTQILGIEHPLAEQLAQLVLNASILK